MVSLDLLATTLHDIAMKLILSTHNVTLTKAIEDHIIGLLDKLTKLNRFAVNARVTLEHDKAKAPERQFSCSIRLTLPGPDLFAADVESDLYAAMDLVTKKNRAANPKTPQQISCPQTQTSRPHKRTRQEAGL